MKTHYFTGFKFVFANDKIALFAAEMKFQGPSIG
jgi:hypothetical protein